MNTEGAFPKINFFVTDVIGKKIISGYITKNNHEIETEHFANGIYFISIVSEGLVIGTKKIVISKH